MASRRGRGGKGSADPQGVALSLATLGRAGDYGALAHYVDATYYDRTYARRVADVEFYLKVAEACGGRILEYGAGSGRVTLPLARAGHTVVAVDLSRPMLRALEAKLVQEPASVRRRVRVVHADMRMRRFQRPFDLVLAPFNTILHLYTEDEMSAFLRRVTAHLGERGTFVFDYSVPRPGDLDRDPERSYGTPPFVDRTTGLRIHYRERFEYDPLRQVLVVWMEFIPERGEPWVVPLAHRQYFPCEMRMLLRQGGLRILRETADFTGREPDAHVDSLVLECRRKV